MSHTEDHPTPRGGDCTDERLCLRDVREIRAVVFGNSHPEKSLLVRMERVETRLAAIQRLSLATLCGVGTLLVKLLGAWIESLMQDM